MARLFSGGDGRETTATARGRGNGLSIIAAGTQVVGELTSDGVVKVEGSVEGTVRAGHQILVAPDGAVEGDLYTREAILAGRVVGSVFADERVEIQPGCAIQGDIVTQRLVVQEGGEVNGNIQMRNPRALEARGMAGAGAQLEPDRSETVSHVGG